MLYFWVKTKQDERMKLYYSALGKCFNKESKQSKICSRKRLTDHALF